VASQLPLLGPEATMRDAVVQLAERRGIAIVVNEGRLAGVLTAGDLTRLMEREDDVFAVPVARVMTANPKMARPDEVASAAVFRMEKHGIMALPVVDDDERVVGVVHLHDLMRAGVA
jgi:arabinose-5-phosphate isomerase